MATRKSKAAPIEEVAQAEVEAWATPGTIGPNGFVPRRRPMIEWVDCSELYPELPDLRAGIDVGVAMRVYNGGANTPGATPVERAMRRLSVLIPQWEGWHFADDITGLPIPCPSPDNPETYAPLVSQWSALSEFGVWLQGKGVTQAITQSMGELQARLKGASKSIEIEKIESAPNTNGRSE